MKGPIVRYLGWDDLPWRGSSQAGMRRRPRRPFPPHIPAHLATLPARTRPPPPARTTLNADMRPFRLRTFISSQQRRANADRCTLLPHPLTSLLTYPATYRDSSGFLASLAAHRTATTTGYAPPSRPSGCAFIPSIRSPHRPSKGVIHIPPHTAIYRHTPAHPATPPAHSPRPPPHSA